VNSPSFFRRGPRAAAATAASGLVALLGGCATVAPDGGLAQVAGLARGRTAGVDATLARAPTASTREATARLLAQPLTADAAVRVALLNNPGLHASLAALGIADAERVRAGTPANPHLSIGRLREGDRVEIERLLRFDLLGLLTLPWRAQWAGQQAELARLGAAQDVVRLAADTQRAWIRAVAARQSLLYQRDVLDAAQAGAELGRRMVGAGNWSRLQHAREQVVLAEATGQVARAQADALSAQEHLTRMLGLESETPIAYTLPDRLPDVPQTLDIAAHAEARALRDRLDVRAAELESRYVAQSLGFTRATGFVDALTLGLRRDTTFDNAAGTRGTRRGAEIELPLPIFDWGESRNARAQGVYLQSAARVRAVAVQARSEAREADALRRTAWTLARHALDEVMPLRRQISDDMLLRYNGMLASPWELLADLRLHTTAVNAALAAQRDFWLADADLQQVLSGTSPAALGALRATPQAMAAQAGGH